MKKQILLIPFFLFYHIVCSQNQEQIPTLKELRKIKSEIDLESYYPVDANARMYINVYLDSNFQLSKHKEIDGKYVIALNEVHHFWMKPRIWKRKPSKVVLESSELTENEFNLSIQYLKVIDAQFFYKRLFSLERFDIENGFITQIKRTKRKSNRLISEIDYSGLYAEENKTWPIIKRYKKDGSVKMIERELSTSKGIFYLKIKP